MEPARRLKIWGAKRTPTNTSFQKSIMFWLSIDGVYANVLPGQRLPVTEGYTKKWASKTNSQSETATSRQTHRQGESVRYTSQTFWSLHKVESEMNVSELPRCHTNFIVQGISDTCSDRYNICLGPSVRYIMALLQPDLWSPNCGIFYHLVFVLHYFFSFYLLSVLNLYLNPGSFICLLTSWHLIKLTLGTFWHFHSDYDNFYLP